MLSVMGFVAGNGIGATSTFLDEVVCILHFANTLKNGSVMDKL